MLIIITREKIKKVAIKSTATFLARFRSFLHLILNTKENRHYNPDNRTQGLKNHCKGKDKAAFRRINPSFKMNDWIIITHWEHLT